MPCLSSRDVALETQPRLSFTRWSLFKKNLQFPCGALTVAVDFRNLPFIPVWEILKCSSVWFSNTSGLSCAENTWSVTETMVWHEEHLVSPNSEPVTVVSGDQVLVAGMVKSLSVYSAENQPWAEILEAAPRGSISLEHLLLPNPTNGAGGDAGIMNLEWKLEAPKVWNVQVSLQRDY